MVLLTRSKVLILPIKSPIFGGLSAEYAKRNICVAPVGRRFRKCGIQRKAVVLLHVHDNFLIVHVQTDIYIPVIFITTNNNENWFWTIQFFVMG